MRGDEHVASRLHLGRSGLLGLTLEEGHTSLRASAQGADLRIEDSTHQGTRLDWARFFGHDDIAAALRAMSAGA